VELTRADRLQVGKLAAEEGKLATMAEQAMEIIIEDGTSVVFPEVVGQLRDDLAKVAEFAAAKDPFGIELLGNRLKAVRGWLNRNADAEFMRRPTSRAEDVPYEPQMGQHVILVAVRERNLKDLYELHRSRTGEELDPSTVKEPQHVNWAVITGEDETGPITITVHRFRGLYEKYKDQIWEMSPDKQLMLVRGLKRREYRRALYAEELWILDPETLKG
jgi:hypothetical protein